jgi:hypothetical protein
VRATANPNDYTRLNNLQVRPNWPEDWTSWHISPSMSHERNLSPASLRFFLDGPSGMPLSPWGRFREAPLVSMISRAIRLFPPLLGGLPASDCRGFRSWCPAGGARIFRVIIRVAGGAPALISTSDALPSAGLSPPRTSAHAVPMSEISPLARIKRGLVPSSSDAYSKSASWDHAVYPFLGD